MANNQTANDQYCYQTAIDQSRGWLAFKEIPIDQSGGWQAKQQLLIIKRMASIATAIK
jgi:hypothetical protein